MSNGHFKIGISDGPEYGAMMGRAERGIIHVAAFSPKFEKGSYLTIGVTQAELKAQVRRWRKMTKPKGAKILARVKSSVALGMVQYPACVQDKNWRADVAILMAAKFRYTAERVLDGTGLSSLVLALMPGQEPPIPAPSKLED